MLNILAVGAQGRGKSNFIKTFLSNFKKRKNWIFDPNQEYNIPNCAKNILTRDEFLELVPHGKNSCVNVVFEEASGFFSKMGGIPQNLVKHICRRYHTKNINIFSYHALTQFNADNLIYIDYIVLFRTQEKPEKVYKNFDGYNKIILAYDDVISKTNGTNFDRHNKVYLPGSYINANGKKVNVSADYSKKFYHYSQIIKIN
jgi:hypothetical protein